MSRASMLIIPTTIAAAAAAASAYHSATWRSTAYAEPAPDSYSRELPSRNQLLEYIPSTDYDVLVIGGGATGCGIALDAASRGMKTCLVERADFGSGTSSRSSKLIHGGVRYLESAFRNFDLSQLALVSDALRERKHMLSVAPHLAYPIPIIVPNYDDFPKVLFSAPYYWLGLKFYDLVAGWSGILKSSYFMTRQSAVDAFPMLSQKDLKCAVVYYDGMQDDARMNMALALTAAYHGAHLVNYVKVEGFIKNEKGVLVGAHLKDMLSSETFDVRAKVVINATGPFSDQIRRMDDASLANIITPSIGTHITLPSICSPQDMGLLIPKTSDGRVLFLLPWQGSTIAGTTDAPCSISDSPSASDQEIEWILAQVSTVLERPVTVKDIHSTWAGIRPLARAVNGDPKSTKSLSRDHVIDVNPHSNLITIAGGKWTTYRSMAEDTVNRALSLHASLNESQPCRTIGLKLVGGQNWSPHDTWHIKSMGFAEDISEHLSHAYGDRCFDVIKICFHENADLNHRLVPGFPHLRGEVVYAVRKEYCQTAVDFIARRSRLAFLESSAARQSVPQIIELMAGELFWDFNRQVLEFKRANKFLATMGSDFKDEHCDGKLTEVFKRVDHENSGCIPARNIQSVVYSCKLFEEYEPKQCRDLIQLLESVSESGHISLPEFAFAVSLFQNQKKP